MAQTGDEKFAGDDEDDHPHRRERPLHEGHQRAGDEDLVRERIEELAEIGDQVLGAGRSRRRASR